MENIFWIKCQTFRSNLNRLYKLSRFVARNVIEINSNTEVQTINVTETTANHGNLALMITHNTAQTPPTAATATTIMGAEKYTLNRSTQDLSFSELTLLDKGLAFVPTEQTPNKHRLLQEFDAFTRRLRIQTLANRWQELHHETDDGNGEDSHVTDKPHPFRMKSNWNPPITKNQALEAYTTNTRNY